MSSSQTTIRLADYEDSAPPEKTIRLSVVDKLLFLDLEKVEVDDAKETRYTKLEGIAVHATDFLNAFNVLLAEDMNAETRQKGTP